MKLLTLIVSLFLTVLSFAQGGVAINDTGAMPDTSAILDISSTSSGLLIPRMTEAQRDAISGSTTSLLIYQTNNDSGFYYWDGNNWIPFLTNTSAANGGWSITGNVGTTPANNFVGTIDSVDWVIKTDSTEQIRVMANGNVGIGTTTPRATLELLRDGALNQILMSSTTQSQIWMNAPSVMMYMRDDNAAVDERTFRIRTTDGNASLELLNDNLTIKNSAINIDHSNGNVGIGNTNPTSTLHVSGSSAARVKTITNADNPYTADNETYIIANASAGTITINLPAASGVTDRVYHVKKTDNSSNAITIDANGSETIDGSLTVILSSQYEVYSIVCDGSSWHVIDVDQGSGGGSTPVAEVIAYMGPTIPSGYLECNGMAISRTTYAALFGVIGVMYGSGDGSTTFNLPDLRGYFLRGFDNTAGNDPDATSRSDRGDGTTGDNVGTKQQDAIQEHEHIRRGSHVPLGVNGGSPNVYDTGNSGLGFQSFSEGIVSTGSSTVKVTTETRSKNVNVRYCIKY